MKHSIPCRLPQSQNSQPAPNRPPIATVNLNTSNSNNNNNNNYPMPLVLMSPRKLGQQQQLSCNSPSRLLMTPRTMKLYHPGGEGSAIKVSYLFVSLCGCMSHLNECSRSPADPRAPAP